MTTGRDQDPSTLSAATIDLAIRLGFIVLLGYWSFRVIAPFLTIGVWSAILTVALYPVFAWLARWFSPRTAAALVTVLCLMIVVGPVTWLGFGMFAGVSSLAEGVETGQIAFPLPTEAVKGWPIVGERLHRAWHLAATNMKEALAEVAPMLKPAASKLLLFAQGALFGLIELLVSIVVAGFLFTRGPQLVDALSAFLSRVLSHRGNDLVQLAGATIRNVSRGVVGIALLQSLLGGVGFLAADNACPALHHLHDPGRSNRQRAQAFADGAWAHHANAGDHRRRLRRHDSLGDCRVVPRPNHSFRRLDGDGGLGAGKQSDRRGIRFRVNWEQVKIKGGLSGS
jgi:predicted PurR-regulated permease PerM